MENTLKNFIEFVNNYSLLIVEAEENNIGYELLDEFRKPLGQFMTAQYNILVTNKGDNNSLVYNTVTELIESTNRILAQYAIYKYVPEVVFINSINDLAKEFYKENY